MPFSAPYDLFDGTRRVLEVLERHLARGVFFVVGEICEKHPEVIEAIWGGGHEIGLHGWRHESLHALGPAQFSELERGLSKAESVIERITGVRPRGFRAPYLLSPRFYDAAVYRMLADHGYLWTSNREVRYIEEALRPDRLRTAIPWRLARRHERLLAGRLGDAAAIALNPDIWMRERIDHSRRGTLKWLAGQRRPFFRDSLVELPIYAPLDCDLVGFPQPDESTPKVLLNYAHWAMRLAAVRQTPFAMFTFHDWIISGANRLSLLDQLLMFLAGRSLHPRTVAESWAEIELAASGLHTTRT
jgi:peptidoglycan/xylan/chitin deacetylase (PgdA/CDA1 family)